MEKKILVILTVVLVILILAFILIPAPGKDEKTPKGQIKDITTNSSNIRVFNVQANEIINSPLVILGEAKLWYFEASFPVRLEDAGGRIITQVPAQAKTDWMTEEFVAFEAKLEFEPPATETGFIVLEQDDPSGLKSNIEFMKIPVTFKGQS